MGGRIGFKGVPFFNVPACAWDVHLGLSDSNVRKFLCYAGQNGIIGRTRFAGGDTVGDHRRRGLRQFLVIFIRDVFNDSTHGEHAFQVFSKMKGILFMRIPFTSCLSSTLPRHPEFLCHLGPF